MGADNTIRNKETPMGVVSGGGGSSGGGGWGAGPATIDDVSKI